MLRELSFVQYDDLLCRNDGRETVCNDDNRLILDQMLQSLLHLIFIFRVGKGGGLVQHQDRGVLQDGPCHTDTLRLATGKVDALISDAGFVTLRKAFYKLMALCGFCGTSSRPALEFPTRIFS